jgi:hypothetical protein
MNLENLRMILSTGSPLNPDNYDYIYTSVKDDLLLGSITGINSYIPLLCDSYCQVGLILFPYLLGTTVSFLCTKVKFSARVWE